MPADDNRQGPEHLWRPRPGGRARRRAQRGPPATPPAGVVRMVVTKLDAQQVWQAALGELQVQMSRPNFETWFKDTALVALDAHRAVIAVPNPFTLEWLQTRCVPLIRKTL